VDGHRVLCYADFAVAIGVPGLGDEVRGLAGEEGIFAALGEVDDDFRGSLERMGFVDRRFLLQHRHGFNLYYVMTNES
jgi:hypothetical protein